MLIILLLVTLLAVATAYQWKKCQKLPKGPTPLPIIGNFHQFVYYGLKLGSAVAVYHHFEKVHGKVFTLWMGLLPTVYISDYDIAHETHIKRANIFSNRFATGTTQHIRHGRGIIASNGEFWQEHRRFALTTLRNFGLGRNIMEEKIMEEYHYRVADYTKTHTKNGAIEIHAGTFFDLLVGSIINQLLISERFEQDDQEFEKIKSALAESLENFGIVDIFFPCWFLETPLMAWRQKKIFKPFDFVYEVSVRNIAKRVAAVESGEHVIEDGGNDFADAYLLKIQKDQRDGVKSTFDYETMAIDVFDLWQAGQETTSTTLTWAFACLLNHPEVAKKLRAELMKLTGGNRTISLTDRPDTPYLNATCNEVQRIASILNINLFRHIEEDTVIAGQPLAAGTALTTQMSMLHTDEAVFKNATEFKPERFLENSNLEKTLIPFGIGKRSCLGESLARAELYLILSNLILDFDIEPVGTVPPIKTLNPFGLLRRPPTYNIRFKPVKH
ncbi:Protein CBR-CYP-34A10 [Caenorhabditis briggsae]|uniref:Protein CBR-CYP-34A10 n=1 Tax=Caenorhabditis briggsae TaxID=6238 RepID=A8WQ04_CAEBR|nr:Protein CBR-CYP-34A10 [Caenorhabditis briggsae]CAP22562.1 Protein CBR-CYP-34A10 [Caenorhabditis briggsae]